MKKLIVIFNLIFFAAKLFAQAEGCHFHPKFKKIYSLSGPFTVALEKMNLLRDQNLAGISVFHPVDKNKFPGEILPGGIFLSQQLGEKLKGSLVIFDKSRELKKMIDQFEVDSIEVETYGLLPQEVTLKLAELISRLTVGCQQRIDSFKELSKKLTLEVLNEVPLHMRGIFFLGELGQMKFPELIMVQDGVLKWLIKEKKLITYPTELAYVPWSSKIMHTLPQETIFIGVKDSGANLKKKWERVGEKFWNVTFPGALIPGVSQLEAWLYLFKNLKSI